MSRKLGDLAIGLVILVFFISGLSYVLFEFDKGLGVSSGITRETSELSSYLGTNTSDMINRTSTYMDDADQYGVTTTEQLTLNLETRGTGAGGVFNIKSKNILLNFVQLVSEKFSIPPAVFVLVVSLITTFIVILFMRFFWGDGRI